MGRAIEHTVDLNVFPFRKIYVVVGRNLCVVGNLQRAFNINAITVNRGMPFRGNGAIARNLGAAAQLQRGILVDETAAAYQQRLIRTYAAIALLKLRRIQKYAAAVTRRITRDFARRHRGLIALH